MVGVSVQLSLVHADGMFSRPLGAWLRLCPDMPCAYPLAASSWEWRQQEAIAALCCRIFQHLRDGSPLRG